jgi:hypothetical protein
VIDSVVGKQLRSFLGQKMQLGFVVRDMDAALRSWSDDLNVGPFVMFEESLGDRKFIHRGRESDVRFAIAFGYIGDVQVEVISPTNSAPSPYQEFFEQGREGLHHLAFWPKNYEAACAELERAGFDEVCRIVTGDGIKNVSYYASPSYLGLMLEVVPMTDARATYFGAIKALADAWDGTRPLRKFKSRAEFLASPEGRA